MIKANGRVLLLLFSAWIGFVGLPATAAPPLTTIEDTLYRADGTLYSGYLQIEWKSFEASDSSIIPSQSLSLRIYKGLFKVQLIPTTTAISSGAFYSVRYVSDGKLQALETWTVPPSPTPLRVTSVRLAPGQVVAPGGVSSVQISDVLGLQEALDVRPRKGAGYSANRTAVINGLGEIEAALGAESDCMTVEGASADCGSGSAGSVSFVDGDTPTGLANGVNAVFVLSHPPNPVTSLFLYRNGLVQRSSIDYTFAGSTVTFLAGAIPQTGDILFASYRLSGSGSASPQVICSSVGTAASGASPSSLGTCTIPSDFLHPGDRVEISADFTHEGAAKAFTITSNWGAAPLMTRALAATETNVAVRISLGVHTANTVFGAQSWGTTATLSPGAGSIAVSYSSPLTLNFLGNLETAGGDSLTLRNYTVTRYPVP